MNKKFAVIFDNGGNTTLQIGKRGFVHCYDTGAQAAEDVKALLDGSDSRGWDGNEPSGREEYDYDAERNGSYKWHNQDEVKRTLKKGVLKYEDQFGNNMCEFYAALGVTIEE